LLLVVPSARLSFLFSPKLNFQLNRYTFLVVVPSDLSVVPWLRERNTAEPSAANRNAAYHPPVGLGEKAGLKTLTQGTRLFLPIPEPPSALRPYLSARGFRSSGIVFRIISPLFPMSVVLLAVQCFCRFRTFSMALVNVILS